MSLPMTKAMFTSQRSWPLTQFVLFCTCLAFFSMQGMGQTAVPNKEYIRLGRRVIAIDAPRGISLSPSTLPLSAVQGSTSTGGSLALSISGGGSPSWTASATVSAPSGGSWLTVSPSSGRGNTASLAVTVAVGSLVAGTYTGTV